MTAGVQRCQPIVEALMTELRNSLAFPFVFEHSGPNLVYFFSSRHYVTNNQLGKGII